MATYERVRIGKRGRKRKRPTQEGIARIEEARAKVMDAYRSLGSWRAVEAHFGNKYSASYFHRIMNDMNYLPSEQCLADIESAESLPTWRTEKIIPCPTCGRIHSRVTNGRSMNCGAPKENRTRLDVTKYIASGMTLTECRTAIERYPYLVHIITEFAADAEPALQNKLNQLLELGAQHA